MSKKCSITATLSFMVPGFHSFSSQMFDVVNDYCLQFLTILL